MDGLNLLAAYFIIPDLVGTLLTKLNKTMSGHYDKSFPLAVVPMFSLCNTRLADVDGNLTIIERMNKFSK